MEPNSEKETFETTIRVVLFNGNKNDWTTWDEKFQARAHRHGYKDILLGRNKDAGPDG